MTHFLFFSPLCSSNSAGCCRGERELRLGETINQRALSYIYLENWSAPLLHEFFFIAACHTFRQSQCQENYLSYSNITQNWKLTRITMRSTARASSSIAFNATKSQLNSALSRLFFEKTTRSFPSSRFRGIHVLCGQMWNARIMSNCLGATTSMLKFLHLRTFKL